MENVNKGLVGWALVVVAIIAATFLGVRFPIPEPPPEDVFVEAVRPVQFRSVNVQQDLTVGGEILGDVTDDLTGDVTGDLTGDLTGNVILNGNTFTATAPITITGVLTNVRLLYVQE